ncbi:type II toxin-antitoxin system PemK/MazF family toxin [Paenibacillus pini]|nr:type II toxin-antitoxin system PemK/MazF family toxin [Paenibacillus pini]
MSLLLEKPCFNNEAILRGDIWMVDLDLSVGSEQGGIRPCLILQSNKGNMFAPTVTIIPMSASTSKKPLPMHVYLKAEKYGLDRDSFLGTEQITTVDKLNLMYKITELDDDAMQRVQRALSIHLSFN